jgi:transcriptional regulator of NAD metabolism
VDDFVAHIADGKGKLLFDLTAGKGKLLSDLTDGVHMHTISCADRSVFDAVVSELTKKGFIVGAGVHVPYGSG